MTDVAPPDNENVNPCPDEVELIVDAHSLDADLGDGESELEDVGELADAAAELSALAKDVVGVVMLAAEDTELELIDAAPKRLVELGLPKTFGRLPNAVDVAGLDEVLVSTGLGGALEVAASGLG